MWVVDEGSEEHQEDRDARSNPNRAEVLQDGVVPSFSLIVGKRLIVHELQCIYIVSVKTTLIHFNTL